MKRILSLVLLAGGLIFLPGLSATARQSSPSTAQPQAAANPEANASPQASSRSRHHRRHRLPDGFTGVTEPPRGTNSEFIPENEEGSQAAPLVAELLCRLEKRANRTHLIRTTRTAKVVRSVLVRL